MYFPISVTLLLHLTLLTNKKAFVYKALCDNGADYRSRVKVYNSYQYSLSRAFLIIYGNLYLLLSINDNSLGRVCYTFVTPKTELQYSSFTFIISSNSLVDR